MTMKPVFDDASFESFIGEFTSYELMKSYRYGEDTMKLERMASFARELGDPHRAYPAIHVAGTKGKGTTCLILDALISAGGRSTGSYLSPHVEHLRERIRVGGRAIGAPDLCATLNRMLGLLEDRRRLGEAHFPTFFELMTAIAMAYFRDRRVDCGIFEVGLGGRLDATNILAPRWTAITSIALEHTGLLGRTAALIAREKAGIIKPGVPVVLGPLEPEARKVILEAASERRAPVFEVSRGEVRLEDRGRLRIEGFDGLFPAGAVRGPGLRDDLGVALAIWRGLEESEGWKTGPDALRLALDTLELPARVEVIAGHPPVVLDGAHTAESVRSLRLALEEIGLPRPRRLVLSAASDKRIDAILEEAVRIAEEFYITRADSVRALEPGLIAARLRRITGGRAPEIRVFEDRFAAFQEALQGNRPVVVTGSFYLAGALRALTSRSRAPAPQQALSPPRPG